MTKKSVKLDKNQINQFFDYGILIPSRIIYLGGEVDALMTETVVKSLHIFKALNPRKLVTLIINTLGGSEYDAWAIYDTMRNLKIPIKTVAHGACMSAGTILFLGGKQRLIAPNCVFMVHDGSDYAEGQRKNVERWAEFGKKYRRYSYKIYYDAMKQKNKKITMSQVEDMCNLDTILTAKETVACGLATRVL